MSEAKPNIPEGRFYSIGANKSNTWLPVQIYLWAESAERGFVEKTAAAIIVIMGFLILMNILAVIIRSRTQTKIE